MSCFRWLALRCLGIGCLLVTGTARSESDLPSPPIPGRFTLTVQSGGFDRLAHVHVPLRYTPEQQPPLVLLLHGAGGSGTTSLDKDRWGAKADREGFLVVAPDGLPALPRLRGSFLRNPNVWNKPVAELLEKWAAAIGCETEPTTVSNNHAVKTVEYRSKDAGPTLKVMYLKGHGHHWPGGRRILPERKIGPITSKLDATDTLWEFFQPYRSDRHK